MVRYPGIHEICVVMVWIDADGEAITELVKEVDLSFDEAIGDSGIVAEVILDMLGDEVDGLLQRRGMEGSS
jgi:hypothetical protein